MTWSFNYTNKIDHLRLAWSWHQRTPQFLRASCGYTDTDEKMFVDKLSKGLNWMGYDDGVPTALVYGEPRGEKVEGHLYNAKHADFDFITSLVTFAKREALNDYDAVVVEIPVRHRLLHGLILRAGFFDVGIHKYKGVVHGRLFESVFYMATL